VKILCVSDQIDPLVYSSSIKERFSDVDIVLSAGDLPLDYLEFIVSSLDKPLYFVFGNHDLAEFDYYRRGGRRDAADIFDAEFETIAAGAGTTYVGSQVRREGKLLIAGLGGSIRYNRGKNQFTDFGMACEIVKLLPGLLYNRLVHGRWLDILLTHASPAGIGDKNDPCHRGFKAFLWFMRKFKPKYLIHGHIHLYDLADIREREYESTKVVNAFSHYIITLED